MSRRKHNRSRRSSEAFEVGPISVSQHGRFIAIENRQTPEEHQEVLRRMTAMAPTLEAKIRETNEKIRALFSKCNAIDLLAHLVLDATPLPTASIESIYSPEVDAFAVEHFSLLALQESACCDIPMVDYSLLEEARQLLQDQKENVIWHGTANGAARIDPHDASTAEFEMLRSMARDHEIFVRGPAYPWDYRRVIEGLFTPFACQLVDELGCSIAEVLAILESLPNIVHHKLRERRLAAKPFEAEVRSAISTTSKGGELEGVSQGVLAFAEKLKGLPHQEREALLKNCVAQWTFFNLSRTMLCSAGDISEFTGIASSKVEGILKHLSMSLGDAPKDYEFPSPTHPLRMRPVIAHDGKYFAPSIGLLLPSVQPLFEQVIRSKNSKTWEKYHNARHNFVLRTALDIFKKLLPNSIGHGELTYTPEGAESPTDLDGLIMSGSVAFLVEVKAGVFSDAARRGAPDRLTRDLKDLVGKAHEQGLRALEYIESQEEVQFATKHGKTVSVKKGEVTSAFLVTITLEPMGHLTCGINSASRFAFMRGDMSRLPWMVGLHDLLAIAEILDAPFILPHYIRARVQLGTQGIAEGCDELDFVGEYLRSGLAMSGEGVRVQFGTATHKIDQYLYQKHGMRLGNPKKPRKTMAPGLGLFLQKLFKSSTTHSIECAFAILDMAVDVQRELLKQIERVTRKAKKDGKPHNITQVFLTGKGWGFTYLCTGNDLRNAMAHYARSKRIEHGVERWLVIGCTPAKPDELVTLLVH